jgi:hypothetical protein
VFLSAIVLLTSRRLNLSLGVMAAGPTRLPEV